MSEKSASCGEQGIDRLLAEAGLDEAYDIRDELLELRALAGTRPEPSAAVRALMLPAAAAPVAATTPLAHTTAAPIDELAARRRRKRRAGIAALAVAASLAAGATAAAASDGGIQGTIEHLGAVVGSVVKQLNPGSGGNAPHHQGTPLEPSLAPTRETSMPVAPTPASTSSDAASSSAHPAPHETPGSQGSQQDPSKGLQDISKGKPPVTIPTPVVPTPTIPLPQPVPSELLPGNPVKP